MRFAPAAAILVFAAAVSLRGQTTVELPEVTVYSPRIANQAPTGTFAMPVSALRYEPRVDLEGRDLVEGQADVTIRGGIFENTGFRIGALTVLDPQTGHYLAEVPVAPAMLGAPEILTGAELATETTNATVGAVAYDWRPVRTAGAAQVGFGPHDLRRGEVYQGYRSEPLPGGYTVGADFDVAHSASAGAIAFGDHRFDRVNGRMQLTGRTSQTDLFAGYQTKFFGWPNLYTPFGFDETENLETSLFALNHRVELGGGDYIEAGLYDRRNKDDYAFNRFAPVGPVHPFQHTTWEQGAAIEAKRDVGALTIDARGEILADFLKSTALTAGHYRSRTLSKWTLLPEKSWTIASGGTATVKAGATYDDSNRDRGSLSPVIEIARDFATSMPRRIYASYAETTQEPTYTALNSSATGGLFRGNPDLGRERTHNAELGAAATVSGWTIDAAVFARRDDSLVDWTFRRGVTARTANAMNVDTIGFETVARRSWTQCDIVIGYTALNKNPDYRGAPVDASFYALNYARQRLTLAATIRLGHGFELRMDNVARIQASNFLRTNGGDDALMSTLGLAYRPAAMPRFELGAQVDNLWNSRFQSVPSVTPSPRQFSFSAAYGW